MRIIITGGFGYLGQRLAKYFHDLGSTVFLGSRNHKKKPLWLTNGNSFITDWNNIDSSIRNLKSIDLIIHAAGMNSSDSFKNPQEALKLNSTIINELIDSCINNGVKNFLYLSTAHVYSSPLEGVISEFSELKNSHPYALSNVQGEKCVLDANKDRKINTKVVRISNCFGAPIDINTNCWHLVVNNICMQAIKDKQIILHSDGKQLRDFIPIDEFCRTLKFIVMNCMKDRNYNVMNIGGKTMDINEITKMVIQIFEKKYNQSIDVIKKDMQTNTKINSLDYKMSWTDKYN